MSRKTIDKEKLRKFIMEGIYYTKKNNEHGYVYYCGYGRAMNEILYFLEEK